jgi:putative ABC transport system substrate-binding protein
MGWLSGGPTGGEGNPFDVLNAALAELGWRQGETLELDERQAFGDASILPRLAAELVSLRPAVIGATGGTEAKALQETTSNIPIVFMQVAVDPVAAGLVQSITRPGANLTGFLQSPQFLWGKRLDILTELLGRPPSRVGFLGNPRNVTFSSSLSDVQTEAAKIGAEVKRGDVTASADLEEAFRNFDGCDAALVSFDFLLVRLQTEIAQLALRHGLPAIYEQRRHVVSGGLVSYGPDLTENYRQGALYIDRILKGTPVSELPVVQGSRFELVINAKAAKAVGLSIPTQLLARADEVIE